MCCHCSTPRSRHAPDAAAVPVPRLTREPLAQSPRAAERNQSDVPCSLNRVRQRTLVLGAGACLPAPFYFEHVGDVPSQGAHVLVIDRCDVIDAERAHPSSREKPPAAPAWSSSWSGPRVPVWRALWGTTGTRSTRRRCVLRCGLPRSLGGRGCGLCGGLRWLGRRFGNGRRRRLGACCLGVLRCHLSFRVLKRTRPSRLATLLSIST